MCIRVGLTLWRNLTVHLNPSLIESRMKRHGSAHRLRHGGAGDDTLLAVNDLPKDFYACSEPCSARVMDGRKGFA
jgi:hypothetical protein